jgi:hypothetical protein
MADTRIWQGSPTGPSSAGHGQHRSVAWVDCRREHLTHLGGIEPKLFPLEDPTRVDLGRLRS